MLDININTPVNIMTQLKDNFKQRRLQFDLTQHGLSKRSGVSLGSLKRFELTGQISLESLLKLALVLECLDDFTTIAKQKELPINSIEDILKEDKNSIKKRGSIR
jgi:transcriptional regulator with XRE-family HTH domain